MPDQENDLLPCVVGHSSLVSGFLLRLPVYDNKDTADSVTDAVPKYRFQWKCGESSVFLACVWSYTAHDSDYAQP